jgi:hypothetical protein
MTPVRASRPALLAIALIAFVHTPPALPDEPTAVHVLITPNAAGVTARFTLERPVESFLLAYEPDEIRDRTWKLSSPNLTRDGSTITSATGEAFSAFEVDIAALNEPTNAIYPCVFKVGAEGLALYAGYFLAHEPQFTTTLEIAPPDNHVVLGFPRGSNTWRVEAAFHHNAGHRYVYVGAREAVRESTYATFVIPPNALLPLALHIRTNVEAAIRFYAARTGFALPVKPLVIVAANPTVNASQVQGDTTSGPAVALRLFGDTSTKFDRASQSFDHLISHEAAHFWNRDSFHPTMDSPAWLWEGGAEYWSTIARSQIMRMTAPARREHIERTLNDCIYRLQDGSLGVRRTNATYVCGEVVQWLADLFERRRTRGQRDVFSVWRRVFAKADANGGVYTLEDFIRAATSENADAKAALSLFLAEKGAERWLRLPSLLAPFGAEIEASPTADETLRKIAVMHVLNQVCGPGSRGMWHAHDHLELDTGDRCGPLSGDPKVDTVNGRSLFTDTPAAYEAIKEACAKGGAVTFSRAGVPGEWTATCAAPLPPAPPSFTIISGA